MSYFGPGDLVHGAGSPEGTCCSVAKYIIFMDAPSYADVSVQVYDASTGDRVDHPVDHDGEFVFEPGAGCDGPWLLTVFLDVGSGPFPLPLASVMIDCKMSCSE